MCAILLLIMCILSSGIWQDILRRDPNARFVEKCTRLVFLFVESIWNVYHFASVCRISTSSKCTSRWFTCRLRCSLNATYVARNSLAGLTSTDISGFTIQRSRLNVLTVNTGKNGFIYLPKCKPTKVPKTLL